MVDVIILISMFTTHVPFPKRLPNQPKTQEKVSFSWEETNSWLTYWVYLWDPLSTQVHATLPLTGQGSLASSTARTRRSPSGFHKERLVLRQHQPQGGRRFHCLFCWCKISHESNVIYIESNKVCVRKPLDPHLHTNIYNYIYIHIYIYMCVRVSPK